MAFLGPKTSQRTQKKVRYTSLVDILKKLLMLDRFHDILKIYGH